MYVKDIGMLIELFYTTQMLMEKIHSLQIKTELVVNRN
jgi:hypothetical protein